ncbi:MAG: substrate-binding domain-containing protein, partial [Alphaproteobacteria bacterium]|nr:substrate-binding domain-containing protein [Alphaproteobacteria bacterium]
LPAYRVRRGLRLSGTFKVAASDVLPDLARRWIAGFEHDYPGVHIALSPPFAGSLGAVELANGKIDAVFVSRELRPSDIAAFETKYGYAPLSVPVSGGSYRHFGFLDSVAFVVNRHNPIAALSFAELDRVLSSTHLRGGAAITTWGQLGLTGEWENRPIHSYGIKPWNGFEEFVRQRVLSTSGARGEWRQGISFAATVFPIAAEVANDPDGIGYTGMAFVDSPVKILALRAEGAGPAVSPSYENVASAAYPLSRLVYFNVNKRPGKALAPALEQFLLYILSRQGQGKVLDQAIYLPLRAGQVRLSRALLAR